MVVNQLLDEAEAKVQSVMKELENEVILRAMENEKIGVTCDPTGVETLCQYWTPASSQNDHGKSLRV